ncbi:response regulator transcription factor [Cochlodiniinecator piscidefendens]|uniref:response regulator transcription factor n=1 Tax=Cochlodiniinecator piscidefendens TaxID=2715756 RepID=UPI00140B4FFA|nr:response regulator transcription factor [Cochlodiniinecator piscidefendens]
MQPENVIRILLADDHMVVRKGLHHVLATAPDLEVIDEAESGEEALYLCQKHKPDVLLMDVQMDGLGGIEATRLVLQHHPAVRVIGLSTFADPGVVSDMMSAGAKGYLLKDVSANELADAIRRIHVGEIVLSSAVPYPASGVEKTVADSSITETVMAMGVQQKRVLALLTKGLTNPEIAAHMKVSLPTARYHVSAILQKLDVSNRVEVVAMAIRLGLISEDDF